MTTGLSGSSYMSSRRSIWMCWCKGCLPMRSPRRRVSPQSLMVCVCSSDLKRALPCLALSCLVLSWLGLSCLGLSCFGLAWLGLSCLVLSCLVLSCLVLSCLVLSCRLHPGLQEPTKSPVLGCASSHSTASLICSCIQVCSSI